jgi:Ca-activated chloride channel family protein
MDRTRRRLLGAGASALAAMVAGCNSTTEDDRRTHTPYDGTQTPTGEPATEFPPGEKIDDWQFDPAAFHGSGGGGGGTGTPTPMATAMEAARADSVGLAAGGAKSIANFRNNLEEGYLPLPSDLSYEGLFYDYFFDTSGRRGGACAGTFCPKYATAVTSDPLSGETERYLSVGLDSGLDSFRRKPLNLVVVLDVSGSMGSSFDEYYYDRFGNRKTVSEADSDDRTKMDVATDAVAAMTTNLREEDRFGMVVFNDEAAVAKPVRPVGHTDMDAIRGHIQELESGGGTNMSAGLSSATELLSEYDGQDRTERETRTIFVTDAMPNLGETSASGLQGMLGENAAVHHYTTFVGVGVDFNSEVVDRITEVEGANYYPVHSSEQFERKLDDEFRYMVTPLVFDLSLALSSSGFDIRKVYGTTAAADATSELMRANTLFPSPKRDGRAKGGVILVQLAGSGSGELALEAEWTTRDGVSHRRSADVQFPGGGPEQFDTTAVRKATLLSRYADLLKNWMVYERDQDAVEADGGVAVPPEELGRWERRSRELVVSPRYRDRIGEFADHFEREMAAIGDDALEQELDVLRKLADYEG